MSGVLVCAVPCCAVPAPHGSAVRSSRCVNQVGGGTTAPRPATATRRAFPPPPACFMAALVHGRCSVERMATRPCVQVPAPARPAPPAPCVQVPAHVRSCPREELAMGRRASPFCVRVYWDWTSSPVATPRRGASSRDHCPLLVCIMGLGGLQGLLVAKLQGSAHKPRCGGVAGRRQTICFPPSWA
jgi:hypothetical protein